MGLNDGVLARLNKQVEEAGKTQQQISEVQDEPIGQTDEQLPADPPAADQSVPDTSAELEALRRELAELKAAKVEQPSSEPEQQAQDDEIQFYATPDERQNLVDFLGEDVVKAQELMLARALNAKDKLTKKKLSELEQRNSQLEKSSASAEFIRSVGRDALDVFNDPTFKALAKTTETGFKRNLLDDLAAIVEGSDLEGAEYFRSQVEKYKAGSSAVRKAQVNSGRSPAQSTKQPQSYDQKKADELLSAMKKHRVGTEAHTKAKAKLDQYLVSANS